MFRLAVMSSVCPDWDLGAIIAAMRRHGYQGLEPRVEWGHACGIEAELSPSGRREVRVRLEGEGLAISCLATGARLATPDLQERAKHLESLRRYIDLAGDLGCPWVRTFGGPRARDQELAQVVEYVAAGYRPLLDQAEARGVTLLLETHDDWCCAAPVRAVVEQVAHARLRVLWDFMHPQRMMEKAAETFLAIGPLTEYLHGHDGAYDEQGRMQIVALGQGIIDHAGPLGLLAGAGFDGYLSVEVIHQRQQPHDAEGVMRQYAEGFRGLLAGL
ncbi:MAG: sugar phosphate isomerase/epimerase [Candidatus Latescibacteria bacterium]|nr:sugar phosphate isomerase/epimerase [Candidatus Latescibacterota bacterium]